MEMNDIDRTIRDFIVSKYLPGEPAESLTADTQLRSTGILNSLATLALISFIEERYGIDVEAHETGIDNFDRLGDIVAFVERKRAAK
jgi:acyl carrier protein